jgi:mono/diheme cytochrome c family protein
MMAIINKTLFPKWVISRVMMKISIFTKAVILLLMVYILIKWAILLVGPPLPNSLIVIYMALAIISILFYITLSNERIGEFLRPIKDTFEQDNKKILRVTILIVFPLLVGYFAHSKFSHAIDLPPELRIIHPANPQQIKFEDETIKIVDLQNPLREDEEHFDEYIKQGASLYFINCVFCHGPKLKGEGSLAPGLNPPPADFTDIGTIAQLQESYLFWRIAKGGPGLPREAHSWNSSMPIWEDYLSQEDIWKVIMFLYEGAGVSPRTWE